jgi:autotransporter adhesin
MLNTLSATTFDLSGHVEIHTDAFPDRDTKRRVNRVLTLDGGVAVNDGGYSDGDLTFELEWDSAEDTNAAILRMLQLYTRAVLSTRAGVFEVAIETYRLNAGKSRLVCLPIARLSA